ncbi:MAG: hypothetical protein H6730_18460 [Deltaproteobacteria bacterium]|nr:hypothetical protein [Deltaproteobacteria bacterium]
MSRKLSLVLGPLLLLLALASGCRNAGGGTNNPTNRPDAGGSTTLTCTQTSDCGGAGVCVAGLCQSVKSCQMDSDCASDGKVCHASRFYCVECDGRPGQCAAGSTCQSDFTCAVLTAPDAGVSPCSGTCADRSECGQDEVCSADGECCPPPSRCRSPNDCPASQPECNGATGQCFGGAGCFQDADCEQETACTGGRCFCDIQGAPPGTCRQRPDECQTDADCFDNGTFIQKFCTVANPPKRCADAPSCSTDNDCSSYGLVCDTAAGSPSMGYCQNGLPCTVGGNECPVGQTCVNNVCVGENCLNKPSLCTANETCDPVTAMCVPNNTGTCTQDTDCQAGYYCNTSSSTCQVGCRDNTECPGGVCNAAHQCEYPMGQFCGPCTTDADCPGGARCVNNPFTGNTCYEQCSTILMQPCSDPNASCIFGNCSCL